MAEKYDLALTLYELSRKTATVPRADSQTDGFLKALILAKPKPDAPAPPEALAKLSDLPTAKRFHAAFSMSRK